MSVTRLSTVKEADIMLLLPTENMNSASNLSLGDYLFHYLLPARQFIEDYLICADVGLYRAYKTFTRTKLCYTLYFHKEIFILKIFSGNNTTKTRISPLRYKAARLLFDSRVMPHVLATKRTMIAINRL